jgi:hypothetical protein
MVTLPTPTRSRYHFIEHVLGERYGEHRVTHLSQEAAPRPLYPASLQTKRKKMGEGPEPAGASRCHCGDCGHGDVTTPSLLCWHW